MFKFFSKKKKSSENSYEVEVVGKCPRCGNSIVSSEDYWACVGKISKTCNFSIPKIVNGQKITAEVFEIYQNYSKYKYCCDIFESKRKGDCTIVWGDERDNDPSLAKARKLKQGCRNCGGELYRLENDIKCTKEKCNYSIKATYNGVTFNDEEISKILAGEISKEYEFENSKGEIFIGRVFIDINSQGYMLEKYKFTDNISALNERYLKWVYAPDGILGVGRFIRLGEWKQ